MKQTIYLADDNFRSRLRSEEQELVQSTGPNANPVDNVSEDIQNDDAKLDGDNVPGQEKKRTSDDHKVAEQDERDEKVNNKSKHGVSVPSEQQIKQLREDFNILADVTGCITKQDLETHWHKQNKNPTPEEIEAVIHATDCDGDGKISFEEFVKLQQAAEQQHFYTTDVQDELMDALNAYDTDGDNVISRDELRAILAGYDDEELDELIADADTNGDGKLSIQELAKLMTAEI